MSKAFGIDIGSAGVYQITNAVNSDRYIGSSVNIWTRWKTHTSRLRKSNHCNSYMQRAWDKYGEENFTLTPLILCERFELERYEQLCLDALKPEYNVTLDVSAPMRGMKFSKEHRDKIAKALIGNKSRLGHKSTEEQKRKISAAHTGKKLSEEHCANIGLSKRGNTFRRGVKLSDETREKLRLSHLGHIPTEETKAKMSESQKANPNNSGRFKKGDKAHLGYKHTEESKKKMSESVKLWYAEKRGES
jgi:group I intron endonuclease